MNVFKKRKWMGAKLFLMLVFLSMAGNAAAKLPNGLEAEMIFAQSDDKTFYGHVFDENGEALIGVTVRNANTKEGTVTDFNGAFSLTLKKGQTATLVFSYVGKKEVKIEATAGKAIKVVMEDDAELLDDVIVTGYQTISKERATGAYSIVKAADLEEKPTANISSMLNGLVPGLAVKGSPTDGGNRFVIRGQGTLQSTQTDIDPLIVVDGFAISTYANDNDPLATINPNDVESITVLKDASATSIYGARAANGVIVITTKKGKEGHKLDISADAFWSVSENADLDYRYNMASAESQFRFVELMNHYDSTKLGIIDPYKDPMYHKYYMAAPFQLLFERDIHKSITPEQYENEKNRLIGIANQGLWKKDMEDYIYQRAVRSLYNVALRGSSERMNYAFSASYNNEEACVIGNESDRIILNLMTSTKLTKELTFDVALSSTFANQYRNGTYVSNLSPWTRLVDDKGNFVHVPTNSTVYQPILDTVYNGNTPADWHYNPVEDRQYQNHHSEMMNYRVQGGLSYNTHFGLNLSVKGQYERSHNTSRSEYDPESFMVRNYYNTFSNMDDATGRYVTYFPTGGIYSESGSDYEAYNLRAQADYNLNIKKHSMRFLAGTEVLSSTIEGIPSITRYGYNKNTNSVMTQPDYVTDYTTILGTTSKLPFEDLGTLSTIEDRYFSVYANAAYTYDDKYSVTASFRTDASNFQSKKQRDKFSPFWSLGGSWLISNEDFMKDAQWLDLLKVRASVGLAGVAAGKRGTSSVTTLATYPGNLIYTNNEAYNLIAARGNETLTWEKSRSVNVGADFSILKGKLAGSIDVYNKFSYDVLSTATVPVISQGTTQSMFNNAEVSNRGFELSLSSNLHIVDDLYWEGVLNYAYNKNEVKKFNMNTTFSAFGTGYVENYPVDLITVMKPAGYTPEGFIILQGKDGAQDIIKDVESSHYLEEIDRPNGETIDDNNWAYYLGSFTPSSNMSFTSRFTWRGLTLSFMLTGRFGYYTYKDSEQFEVSNINASGYNKSLDDAFRVYDEGYDKQTEYSAFPLYTDASFPVYKGNDGYAYAQRSSLYFENMYMKGDHIRLNEVYLGYDLPKSILTKQNVFKRVNVYAQASNLGILWSADDECDPDYPLGTLKPMTNFTFGLKIGF